MTYTCNGDKVDASFAPEVINTATVEDIDQAANVAGILAMGAWEQQQELQRIFLAEANTSADDEER